MLRMLGVSRRFSLQNFEKKKSWSSPMERNKRRLGVSAHAIVILRVQGKVSVAIHWIQRGKLLFFVKVLSSMYVTFPDLRWSPEKRKEKRGKIPSSILVPFPLYPHSYDKVESSLVFRKTPGFFFLFKAETLKRCKKRLLLNLIRWNNAFLKLN